MWTCNAVLPSGEVGRVEVVRPRLLQLGDETVMFVAVRAELMNGIECYWVMEYQSGQMAQKLGMADNKLDVIRRLTTSLDWHVNSFGEVELLEQINQYREMDWSVLNEVDF